MVISTIARVSGLKTAQKTVKQLDHENEVKEKPFKMWTKTLVRSSGPERKVGSLDSEVGQETLGTKVILMG